MTSASGTTAPAPASTTSGDIAPLAWVIDEVRASLRTTLAALKRFLAHKSDVEGLRRARDELHQVAGALQVLELGGVSLVMEAVENLLTSWEFEPASCLPAAVRTVDAALGAVRRYLEEMLAGRSLPPVRLYPYYRDVLALLGAARIHPADLLLPDLERRPDVEGMATQPLSTDALRQRRIVYEAGLLQFLRDPADQEARALLRTAVSGIEAMYQHGLTRSFWWVVGALFDALERSGLPVDADLKRFLARLNQQLRRHIDGGAAVAERLMIDALYHVGQADRRSARVDQVRQLYELDTLLPADFERPLLDAIDADTRLALDAALEQCKLLWSQAVASALPNAERFRTVALQAQAAAERLGWNAAARMLACIAQASSALATGSAAARAALGMEVATGLLLLDSDVASGTANDPQFAVRTDAIIARIGQAAAGEELAAGDPWITELARRAQERSSMATVISELRGLLREIELRLDRYFRNPAHGGELMDLQPMLEEVAGVLAVLGFEDPALALRQVQLAVEHLANPTSAPDPERFADIAQNLGAVGFFVAGLAEQPDQPRGRYAFDHASGLFVADLAPAAATRTPQAHTVADSAAGQPAPSIGTSASADTAAAAASAGALAELVAGAGPAGMSDDELPTAAPQDGGQALVVGGDKVEHAIERLLAAAAAAAADLDQSPDPGFGAGLERIGRILEQLSDDAELTDDAALQDRVAAAVRLLAALRQGAGSADGSVVRKLQALLQPGEASLPAPTAPLPTSSAAADRELRGIFVDEADEILESVKRQLARLRQEPGDAATLTMTRRAFHTLKGSSRMVGLHTFGEFAWALEQCFNLWLAHERPANADLLDLAAASADRLRDWIEALRSDPQAQIDTAALIQAARSVRDGGSFVLPRTHAIAATAAPHSDASTIAAAATPATSAAVPSTAPPQPPREAGLDAGAAEDVRRIGPLAISHGLYSVFLAESDECVRALAQDLGEWRYEPARAASEHIVRRAHTLAGISDTIGLTPVCAIADPLDAFLQDLYARRGRDSARPDANQFAVLERGIERIRGMLHQFAAGLFPEAAPEDARAVRELLQPLSTAPGAGAGADGAAPALPPRPEVEEVMAPKSDTLLDEDRGPTDAAASAEASLRDDLDPQLLQVFTTEAQDLLPVIARGLRSLAHDPGQRDIAREVLRTLHTVKGSARMAGAMRLGELVHEMEARIEPAGQLAAVPARVLEELQSQFDRVQALFEALLQQPTAAAALAPDGSASAVGTALQAARNPASTAAEPGGTSDTNGSVNSGAAVVRVRADILDRLVDHAGEVAIARTKLETEMGTVRSALTDLTENIQRLRSQLREVELQADAQIQARSDQVAKQSSSFDPLEFDRFSRLQELTRLLAESVEDVALVQSNMLKGLQRAENELGGQSRLTRELQQQLMRVRLVPFANVSERLYRVARQAAKELHKRVHLDILGADTQIDRGQLEQLAGPFEHLVRNAIVHGLELPEERVAAGKAETGELRIEVQREGNEIVVIFDDDGRGLDLASVRARAIAIGLVASERKLEERELIDLIFRPGLSTARELTELAGRGIGMDVVRAQVGLLGGRIAVTTRKGAGTRFTLYLPTTVSVMQVVLATVGQRRYAVPAAMVERAQRARGRELISSLQAGAISLPGIGEVTVRPLSQLLGQKTVIGARGQYALALLRLGDDRLAVCADALSASQEVVVKNVGPQVARLAGILGATVLGNGEVVLIINPVQLIGRAPEPPILEGALGESSSARADTAAKAGTAGGVSVMIVDDSLTVRRVTQRLLERNGYRTVLAKDGAEALRELQDAVPDIILADIEMPRMNGYDLTRNVRSSPATRHIPIIMITSRTAEKHRRMALDLGVNEYLGKPYREDELLELLRNYLGPALLARTLPPVPTTATTALGAPSADKGP